MACLPVNGDFDFDSCLRFLLVGGFNVFRDSKRDHAREPGKQRERERDSDKSVRKMNTC